MPSRKTSNQNLSSRAAKDLLLSRDGYLLSAEQCDCGIVLLDDEGIVTHSNKPAEELTGYLAEETKGKNFFQLLAHRNHGGDRGKWHGQEFQCSMLHDGGVVMTAIKGQNEITKYLELKFLPNKIAGQDLVAVIISDRTEVEEMKRTIEEKTKFIQNINEHANMIVMRLKPDGTILSLNKKGERVTGYNEYEVVGENWFSTCLLSSDQHSMSLIREKIFQGKDATPYACEIKTRGGELRFVSWTSSAIQNEKKELAEIILFGVDITAQKILQDEIKKSEEKYRALFESSKDAIYAIDLEGNFFAANSSGYELTGYRAEELIGKNHLPLFHRDDQERVHKFFKKSTQGEVTSFEARLIRKDGEVIELDIKDSPICQEGKIIGVYGAGRDITEKKKADEQISRMNRLLSLGQLLAGVAHEIRNPLSGLNLNVGVLARRLEDDAESHEVIKDIRTAINRMEYTVRSILDFARPKVLSFETINLNNLIEDSYNLVKMDFRHHSIEATFSLEPNLPPILGSPYQIEQALINILLNAKEAMPQGGVVRIVSKLIDSRKAILLSITDTGVGIQEKDLSKIFDPFYTTKYEGTGLGLSIACRNLEQVCATIRADSKHGEGTTFLISFPAQEGRFD